MGTETACGSYYSEPPAGPSAAAMAGYYRMSSDESGPARSESLTDEELAQATVSASDCETDHDLHQAPQQQQQHPGQHQQPSPNRSHLQQHMQHGQHQHTHQQQQQQQHHTDSAGRTNHWAVSQQLQNHITNTSATVTGQGASPGPSPGRSSGNSWSFPNYQRLYNENSYSIAIAAAAVAASSQAQQHNMDRNVCVTLLTPAPGGVLVKLRNALQRHLGKQWCDAAALDV
uniref:Uncharacterized protein n=1 Tax=Anopheles dirus TaxID=7168 RepID=A0A182NIG6_9DIPT